MSTDEIVPLVKKKISTIVGFDPASQPYTIGDEARRIGLKGEKPQSLISNQYLVSVIKSLSRE